MNLRILNYFLTVVREKNITKAAEILHITQPTLSRQLIQLETELGVKLFDRDKHKFALTPSGQFLVERAREILNMVEKTTLDIQEQEQNLAGSILWVQANTRPQRYSPSLSAVFKSSTLL